MVTTGVTLEDIYKLIKEGNQELKGQINSLSETVSEAKREINNINNKYRDIEKENSLLKSKILNLENKLKKYNIVIYGVKESDKGPMEDTLSTIEGKLEFQTSPSADKNTKEQLIPQDTKRGENRLQYEPSRVNKLVPAGPSKSTPTSSHKGPKLRSTSK
ncbi:unnamed protein product [Acanthoscelides obtectus]|uniref:Uncharacterized protein n=1 Tax=Acanthoscelides obtectus TaxID=200917 RepID=A0A9P0LUV6_ACAOB|nr:unnamed protein product [Acanthoscelides obtectus]CAK1627056.1 hypothetical protein AOBTE_LOCUS4264 [Acanthoscelides obtectus]